MTWRFFVIAGLVAMLEAALCAVMGGGLTGVAALAWASGFSLATALWWQRGGFTPYELEVRSPHASQPEDPHP